jgi:hypothetical protein
LSRTSSLMNNRLIKKFRITSSNRANPNKKTGRPRMAGGSEMEIWVTENRNKMKSWLLMLIPELRTRELFFIKVTIFY